MKSILAILALVCGTTAIYDGIPAQRAEFPFVVRVSTSELDYGINIKRNRNCLGSIVSPNMVVTAAHCVHSDLSAANTSVITKIRAMDNQTRVAKALVHEDFQGKTSVNYNDLAVLVLNYPLEFNSLVQPINIPTGDQVFQDGQICGFANITQLLKTNVPIVSGSQCRLDRLGFYWALDGDDWYWNLQPDLDKWKNEWLTINEKSIICSHGRDGCITKGDSGGPLVCHADNQAYLCGVTSTGTANCTTPYAMMTYAAVANCANWINARVSQFNFTCPGNEFNCGNGTCVSAAARCDGKIDCPTGTDEFNCSPDCWDRFKCAETQNCIDADLVCDGKISCGDGYNDLSDEVGCAINENLHLSHHIGFRTILTICAVLIFGAILGLSMIWWCEGHGKPRNTSEISSQENHPDFSESVRQSESGQARLLKYEQNASEFQA